MFRNKKIVPVLMFHSVGLEKHDWVYSHISEPLYTFREILKYISKYNFNCVFWNDLYKYMKGKKSLPNDSIMLTFDDGYLDNWVYVYPLLKKYGLKATIFISPEFVDTKSGIRLNLEDVWNKKCEFSSLQPAGFLSWEEMREMLKSGIIDIQSHSLTHTWYFSSPKIVDFHQPQKISQYPWLFWNERPERKPYYLSENQKNFLPFGYPIFQYEKSLLARRYFPDKEFVKSIIEYFDSNNKNFYYSNQDSIKDLLKYITNYKNNLKNKGYYESYEERKKRIENELQESKNIIQKKLDKKVNFICWPGGGYDKVVLEIAKKTGYKAWTLSSSNDISFRNLPINNAKNIKRIGTSSSIKIKGYGKAKAGAFYHVLRIWEHQNSFFFKHVLRVYKIFCILKGSFN